MFSLIKKHYAQTHYANDNADENSYDLLHTKRICENTYTKKKKRNRDINYIRLACLIDVLSKINLHLNKLNM